MKWLMAAACLLLAGCDRPLSVFSGSSRSIAVLRDGSVLVRPADILIPLPDGGYLAGNAARLDRYLADGSRESSFRIERKAKGQIRGVAVRPDGRIVIGGKFQGGLELYQANGQRDPNFSFPNIPVLGFASQEDGRIVVVSSDVPRLAGYLPDGTRERSWRGSVEMDGYSLSPSWATALPGNRVFLTGAGWVAVLRPESAVAVPMQVSVCDLPMVAGQADGRVVFACNRTIQRLLPDGTPDSSFRAPDIEVRGLAAKADSVLVLDSSGKVTELK